VAPVALFTPPPLRGQRRFSTDFPILRSRRRLRHLNETTKSFGD
jgi:hypothetical protein